MVERDYVRAILEHLEKGEPGPVRARRLARLMGVARDDYGEFRRAYKTLRDSGRLVLGAGGGRTLPSSPRRVTGRLALHPKGFAFLTPEDPVFTEDLFVPPGHTGGAMNGDRVAVRRLEDRPGRRRARLAFEVVEVLERGQRTVVGTLERAEGVLFVLPEGKQAAAPVVVRDAPPGLGAGAKVVVELVEFPSAAGELAAGAVVEVLGRSGELEAETLAIVRAYGLADRFSEQARAEARAAAAGFDPEALEGREDLTGLTVVTIDPAEARDFDDAISLGRDELGRLVAGVHIADVAHFVREGGALDAEARERGTSTYFPRRVVPMLPETLSNVVCSLQQGQRRFTRSVFITYGERAEVVHRRVSRSVIASAARLTYEQAEAIVEGGRAGQAEPVVELVREAAELARTIRERRRAAGMLHLDLPEVRLVIDEGGEVRDAEPEPHLFSHTLVEMLMVEANEAVAGLLAEAGQPFVGRIHPEPDDEAFEGLATFVRALGLRFPRGRPDRASLQALVDSVAGRPEGYAVNLALLRSFQRARYSAELDEHYALASPTYCHFTSPIRRYPDLAVHRAVDAMLGRAPGRRRRRRPEEEEEEELAGLQELADHCSRRERLAEAAELELRSVLVLRHLGGRLGEVFDGVVTGVTDLGLFVQFPRFLVEGLVRLQDLGDDWWQVDAARGRVVGELTGVSFRLGDVLPVRIAAVDLARRLLDLALAEAGGEDRGAGTAAPGAAPGRRRARPAAPQSRERGQAGGRGGPKRRGDEREPGGGGPKRRGGGGAASKSGGGRPKRRG